VTAICDSFAKKPFGGNQTDSGVFDVQKISVINGAQTIGSLAKAKSSGVSIEDVFVHVRIISLQGTPEGFSSGVTRSNNTQNDLNASDFVAFDPNQERLRREAVQLGITYAFRRGEPDPPPGLGFNIRTATTPGKCVGLLLSIRNGSPPPPIAAAQQRQLQPIAAPPQVSAETDFGVALSPTAGNSVANHV
jgi:hypothetical protein